MPKYDLVLFDLDGTLTDSSEGIVNSIRYALEKLGKPVPTEETLRRFIGPPLLESFRRYCKLSEEESLRAFDYYQERYLPTGWRENRVYPGIRCLLRALKEQGVRIMVVTGKSQDASEKILDYFRLLPYMERVVGTTRANRSEDKKQLIKRALEGVSFRRAVMIGDRASDILAAQAMGIEAIAAGYGLGEKNEFDAIPSCALTTDVAELYKLLLESKAPFHGYFLTIEGLDGCGKTTQADAVERVLRDFGYRVRRTREPGGCAIAERIRELLLDVKSEGMTDRTEALLYAAARAQHVQEVILPAMARGEIVLCDRFVDSSIAFQGGGRQLGAALIKQINAPALQGCMPDATVYLRLNHQTSLSRRGQASTPDRIEREKASFHQRVEEAYDALAARQPGRFMTFDAQKKPQEITREILAALLPRLDEAEVC